MTSCLLLWRLGFYVARLGRSLIHLGRFDEAERLAERARDLENESGPATVRDGAWREVLARVYSRRGELAEAEQLAREAVVASEQTQWLNEQCLALWDLAEVLAAAGRADEAPAVFEQALDGCRRKKNLALARQVRERLAELGAEAQSVL